MPETTRSNSRTAVAGDVVRVLNLLPSTGTETDWLPADAADAGLLAAPEPPPSVDLRKDWWSIGDQGATGSCVGWATADGVGRYTMVKAGRIGRSQRLSPRFIWMASKETDEFTTHPTTFVEEAGTSLKAAVDIGRQYGFALESELPFTVSTTMYTGPENALFMSAARRRISYVNLGGDRQAWKSWLSQRGPILAGLSVDENWMNVDSSGLLSSFTGNRLGGHAVCIVGYREDGRFIVRNSWGTQRWGDRGFAYVAPAYLDAAFFPESYGAIAA